MASERALRALWVRFAEAYGGRWATPFGDTPNDTWREALESVDDATLERATAALLAAPPDAFVPTLPRVLEHVNRIYAERARPQAKAPPCEHIDAAGHRCTRAGTLSLNVRAGGPWFCSLAHMQGSAREPEHAGATVEDIMRQRIAAHPEWQKGETESSDAYARRMLAECKRIARRGGGIAKPLPYDPSQRLAGEAAAE